MYNHNIDTFLRVVESGSFSSASEQLHMTSPGILKQIRSLENILNVSLFKRSTRGVELTENGRVFLTECHRIINVSEDVLRKTRRPSDNQAAPIRVGASILNPTDEFNRICKLNHDLLKYAVHIVSYPTDINNSVPISTDNAEYAEIGFATEPSIEHFVETDFLQFSEYKLTCAVPINHPLARKEFLTMADLEGTSLFFPSRGNPRMTEAFSLKMHHDYPNIIIESPSLFYDLEIFNRCAEEGKILVSLCCWDDIHPGLVNLPVDWEWKMPYGLIWKKSARKEVIEFISAFKEVIDRKTIHN